MDLVPGSLSCLNLLRDLLVQGSQEVNMPQPAQGPNSLEGNMPQPRIRSLGVCHTSDCLGICTLTQGHPVLRLQQYWVG